MSTAIRKPVDDAGTIDAFRIAVANLSERLTVGHLADDESARFPREKWSLLADQGVLALAAPTDFGGLGQDLRATMEVLEEVGYRSPDAGLNFSISTQIASSIVPIARFGRDTLKRDHLPGLADGSVVGAHAITEPEAGSDAFAMSTRAEIRNDVVILNGTKAFVSNGPIADVIVVYGRAAGRPGLTAVVVPTNTPGVSRGTPLKKMGLRTSPLCEVFLDDVRVPASNILGAPGNGYFVLDYVMKREILFSFIINVGETRARIDRVVAHARSRQQFGAPIGSFQSVANRIVNMRIGYRTARLWLYEAAAGLLNNRDVTEDIAIAKILASEAALDSARNALYLHGGYGFMSEYGLEKQVRDTSAGPIYSGSNDIQLNKIAQIIGL